MLDQLTKVYGDPQSGQDATLAVDHVSLTIPSGQLVGYLGPNGAGKSTTVKMLTGMIAPTSGRAEIDVEPIDFGDSLGQEFGIEMIFG